MVCRELGFGAAISASTGAQYGQGYGPIQLDDLGCSGLESSILLCSHAGIQQHNCGHSEDAGVQCTQPSTADGKNPLWQYDRNRAASFREIEHL